MSNHHQKRVDGVVDTVGWILDSTGVDAEDIMNSAVHAVDHVDKQAGMVLVHAKTLDSLKRTLEAIASRGSADVQTIMWARQGLKTLSKDTSQQ